MEPKQIPPMHTAFAPRPSGRALIALSLCAALAACGGGGGGGSSSAATDTAAAATTTPTAGASAPATTTPTSGAGGATTAPVDTTPTIGTLAAGTGVVTFGFNPTTKLGEIVAVDPTSGAVRMLSNPCSTTDLGFEAADLRADGTVIAAADDLYRLDVSTGECVKFATAPQALAVVAVRSDNTMVAISRNRTAGLFTIYGFDANGALVASSARSLQGNFQHVKGVDFGPDGKLYVSGFDSAVGTAIWTVDPSTGVAVQQYLTTTIVGDIDIDAAGVLRANGGDGVSLRAMDYKTGVERAAVPVSRTLEKLFVYR